MESCASTWRNIYVDSNVSLVYLIHELCRAAGSHRVIGPAHPIRLKIRSIMTEGAVRGRRGIEVN